MDTLLHDLRYAARSLRRSPGFTIVAVATLALGIGANTAIFTLINTLLLRPPAHVRQPEQLVSLYTSDYSGPRFGTSSYPDFADFRARADVFSGMAAYTPTPFSLRVRDQTARTWGETVSGDYFSVLGVAPAAGRWFAADEAAASGANAVVVISYALWQRTFGGEPGAVGQTVRITGQPYTIIGIAPAGFVGSLRGIAADLWVPLAAQRPPSRPGDEIDNRGNRSLFVIGRLKPGVTVSQAQARFDVIATQMHAAYAEQWTDVRKNSRVITLIPERESRVVPQLRGPVLAMMGLLMAVAGLVLLICCANVANLLLARATGRQREVAIRLALGAGRGRLVRQFLTESALLSTIGGGLGLLLASWTVGLLAAFKPPVPVPVLLDLSVDGRVLAFAAVTAIVTGVLFGLVPALRATRPVLVPALKQESNTMGAGHRRFGTRNVLVVTQVAVSLVLLITAGLLLQSLRNAQHAERGFNPTGVAMLQVELGIQGYDAERSRIFYQQLAERAAALPGVKAASLASSVPLGLNNSRQGIEVEGRTKLPGEDMEFGVNVVAPRYFAVMEIPLLRGRDFTNEDRSGAPGAAIVNETFAARFWPNESPLGKRFKNGGAEWREVIGVAKDGKYGSLGEGATPFFYVPLLQSDERDMMLEVRTAGDAAALLPALRREARALDADVPVTLTTMEEQMAVALLPQRLAAMLLGVFGLLGLALAAIGLYGVMAYSVSQRTREIGVRMALGARAEDVRALVLGQGMRLTAAGLLIGLVASAAFTRLTSSLLYGVGAADPVTFGGISLLLAVVAALASYLPARRATRLDPVAALRHE